MTGDKSLLCWDAEDAGRSSGKRARERRFLTSYLGKLIAINKKHH